MALSCLISSPQRARTKNRISEENCFSKKSASDSVFASKAATEVLPVKLHTLTLQNTSSFLKVPLCLAGFTLEKL